MELKKWKSFDELTTLLEEKGIIISDRSNALFFLKQVSYYRFSGYFILFDVRHDNEKTIQFETIRNVYEFDEKLRHLISGALDDIETFLKNQIGHYQGEHYGAEGYMNPLNYNVSHNDDIFKRHFKQCISANRHTLVVKHHISKYEGHFPIWVIIEFFSLGMLSYFYSDLLNHDRKYLARYLYGVHFTVLSSWLRCITELRNKCAHFTRLYGWIFTSIPQMPDNERFIPDRTLFTQLMILKYMYPDHEKWNSDFMKSLKKLIKVYKPYIRYEHIGFPYRWKSMLQYR